MSPGMSALSSVGITQPILILFVLAAVAAGIIGLFWHYILPGAIIIGVASLFIVLPEDKPKTPDVVETEVEKPFDEHEAFIQDCVNIAEYSVNKCEKIWAERQDEEEQLAKKGV